METATRTSSAGMHEIRPIAAERPVAGGAWNKAMFTMLGTALGQAKVDGIAMRFLADLQNRFADLHGREALRKDAHVVASTAGMLGFASLSQAARTLDTVCSGEDDFTTDLSQLLRCRRVAVDLLAQHFGQA